MLIMSRRLQAFLLFALGITVFLPQFFVGFTTQDDAQTSLYGNSEFFVAVAQNQGRYAYLWAGYVAQLPYVFDNPTWLFATKALGFCFLLFSIFWTSGVIFESSDFARLHISLFIVLIQNGWSHNLLTSYPFLFNVTASCFVISLGFFKRSLDTGSRADRLIAAVTFGVSVGEIFVGLILIFLCLAWGSTSGKQQQSVTSRFTDTVKLTQPIAISFGVHLAIYFLWRLRYPSTYDGNQLASTGLQTVAKTNFLLGVSSFPLESFYRFSRNFSSLFRDSPYWFALTILFSLGGSLLITSTLNSETTRKLDLRFKGPALALSFISIFLVLLPISLVSKYQLWVEAGTRTVQHTYFATIFAAASLGLGLLILSKLKILGDRKLRVPFLVLVGSGTFILCAVVQVNNYYFYQDQVRSNRKWELVNQLISSPLFTSVPHQSAIVAPNLVSHRRGIAVVNESYWEQYIESRTGKSVRIVANRCESDRPCFFLDFVQDRYQDEQYVIFASTDGAATTTRSLNFIAIPGFGGRFLNGQFAGGEINANVRLAGEKPRGLVSDFDFSIRVPCDSAGSTNISIVVSSDIMLNSISVGIGQVPQSQQLLRVTPLSGAYLNEDDGCETWTWFRETAALEIFNPYEVERSIKLSGELNSIHSEDVFAIRSVSNDATRSIINSAQWTSFDLTLKLLPGSNLIRLSGEKEEILAGIRYVSFRIRDLVALIIPLE